MFTLSGAHVFPMYDGAVQTQKEGHGPQMRLLDVRHEQTAAFAAEATGKLTRVPGLAVLTAGPGVTNGISAIAQAQFAGSPMVVVGGRAPQNRWGTGSLQELDQPPIIAPVAKAARTLMTAGDVAAGVDEAFTLARSSHRGPVFVDVPMDEFFNSSSGTAGSGEGVRVEPDRGRDRRRSPGCWRRPQRPVLILGTDVWADHAEASALRFVEDLGIPTLTNGMGRGVIPGGHRSLVTKARGAALSGADLVVVVGTPLDFRLGYGVFGGPDKNPQGEFARVVHIADSPGQVSGHAELAALGRRRPDHRPRRPPGRHRARRQARLARVGRPAAPTRSGPRPRGTPSSSPPRPTRSTPPASTASWSPASRTTRSSSATAATSSPSPASTSSRSAPAAGSTPAPTAASAPASARPSRPASPGRAPRSTLLLGDGAAGFSLMDVDTLVRHDLPVVMVMGNNSAWGLEKGPMQMLYGYDVVADLAQRTPYDEVVQALGGGGRDGDRPEADRAGPRPGLRLRRALPRQRDHRRRGGLPAQHVRHLRPWSWRCAGSGPRSTPPPATCAWRRTTRSSPAPRTTTASGCTTSRPATRRPRSGWPSTDDRVVGVVTYCPPGSPWREIGRDDEGEFRMLAVDPAAQGAGAGTALARLCEERAREHGATGMALSSLATMTSAHRVYARLGYTRDPGARLVAGARGATCSPSRKVF